MLIKPVIKLRWYRTDKSNMKISYLASLLNPPPKCIMLNCTYSTTVHISWCTNEI